MVQLKAFVTVAGLAVHAALRGLLYDGRLTHVTHDGNGGACRLSVALHDALQRKVPEQHTDAPLTEIDITLAAGAREGGDARRDRRAPPTGRGRHGP